MKKNTLILCALAWCSIHTTVHATISNRFYGFASMAFAYALDSAPERTYRGVRRVDMVHAKQTLKSAMLEEPLARFFASRKLYRFGLSCIPFIGKHMQCTNKQCQGICNDCKLKFLYTELPFQMMMLHSRQTLVLHTDDDFINGAETCATWLWCVVNIFSKIFNPSVTAQSNEQTTPNDEHSDSNTLNTDGANSQPNTAQENAENYDSDSNDDSDCDDDDDE